MPWSNVLKNPQSCIEKFVEIIPKRRHNLAVDGIRYYQLAGAEYDIQEIFDSAEFLANLDRNAVAVDNSVYDHIIYGSSTVELPFAKALDKDPDVKMFFKIPSKFKIDTLIGTYNPDWAVCLEHNGVNKQYFVLETKGDTQNMRGTEEQKIHCGQAHLEALNTGVEMKVVKNWNKFQEGLVTVP